MNSFYFQSIFAKPRGNGDNPPPPAKTFTQDEVNAMMAEHKRNLQAQLQQTQAELDKLKASGKNVEDLQKKITELTNSQLTKEELAKQEQDRIKAEYEAQIGNYKSQAETFKGRHDSLLISDAVTKAAAAHDAFSADQLLMLLGGRAKVVEDTDNQGRGVGTYKVLAPVTVEGKVLELPVADAVAKMREDKSFGNLFKVKGTPGTGLTLNHSSNVGSGDATIPTDPNQYFAKRDSLKQQGVI